MTDHIAGKTDLAGIADRIKRERDFSGDAAAFGVLLYKHESIDVEAALRSAVPEALRRLEPEQVEWVVNDIAELGVKIGDQFFWLYKGHSLVYGSHDDSEQKDGICQHDDGGPMHWRPVFKREFGECCHPVNYDDLRACGHPHYIGTVSLHDSDEWKPLPVAVSPQGTLVK